jgi:hypothetical protein
MNDVFWTLGCPVCWKLRSCGPVPAVCGRADGNVFEGVASHDVPDAETSVPASGEYGGEPLSVARRNKLAPRTRSKPPKW